MPANDRQVDGDHYKGELQHWDIVHLAKLDYFQAQILRYIMRHRKKHGLKDLQKAQHFIEKYMELEYPEPELAEPGNFDSACICGKAWQDKFSYHLKVCPHYVPHGGEVPQGDEDNGDEDELAGYVNQDRGHITLEQTKCSDCRAPYGMGHLPGCSNEHK